MAAVQVLVWVLRLRCGDQEVLLHVYEESVLSHLNNACDQCRQLGKCYCFSCFYSSCSCSALENSKGLGVKKYRVYGWPLAMQAPLGCHWLPLPPSISLH
jgi:hypothetical protein